MERNNLNTVISHFRIQGTVLSAHPHPISTALISLAYCISSKKTAKMF